MTIKDLIEKLRSYPGDTRLITGYQNGQEVILFPEDPPEPKSPQGTGDPFPAYTCLAAGSAVIAKRNTDGHFLARSAYGDVWVQAVEYARRFETAADAEKAVRNFNPRSRAPWINNR